MDDLPPLSGLRLARLEDGPAIERLVRASVHGLQADVHTFDEREAALGVVFGLDTRLVRDGTYFVIGDGAELEGCGGWSFRATPFGADAGDRDDRRLDPAKDAARVRAFFVHPDRARRGVGSRILTACEAAAADAGFRRLELTATLTGEPFYARRGFVAVEQFRIDMADGLSLPAVRMRKTLV